MITVAEAARRAARSPETIRRWIRSGRLPSTKAGTRHLIAAADLVRVTHSVNIHDAKTHLSRLVERVEAGEEIVIARGGKPVARLVPLSLRTRPRQLGTLRGRIWLAPDWDSPEVNAEIARDFEA